MSRKDIILRSAILLLVAVLAWLLLASIFRRPIWGMGYYRDGVTLFWNHDTVEVMMDGRHESVPRDQLESSRFYQEAVATIPPGELPRDTEMRLRSVRRWWTVVMGITWWLLFRVWQPRFE